MRHTNQMHNMSQSQYKPELFSEQRPIYGMQGIHAGLNNNQPIHNYQVGTDTHRHSRTINHHSDLQLKLPFFNGKGNWQGFWVQFELMSRHYRWNTDEQCDHLIMTLRDEALVYVSQLTPDIRHNLYMLVSAMKRRFDDPVLAETHRANLQCVSKKRNESVQEYAARINSITSKAYPGFQGTEMFQKIAIEHMLKGLDDPGVAYDVQTKRPKSMAEAVDMITWHECCRMNSRRRSNIRQLGTEISYCPEIRNTQYADEDSIRRITDERLAKFEEQFMQSMREGISQATSAQQDYDGAPKPAQQLHPEDYMAVNDENSQMMRHTDVIKTMDARSNIGNYTDSKVRTVQLDVNKTAIDTTQGQDEEANKTINMINSVSILINKREKFKSDTKPHGDTMRIESIAKDPDIKVRRNNDQEVLSIISNDTTSEGSIPDNERVTSEQREVTIRVNVQIMDQPVKAVVDTGAGVTVLSDRVYKSLPESLKSKLRRTEVDLVVAEEGKKMRSNGVADVQFKLGDLEFGWTVHVAPIRDDLLLGCDILHAQDITINTRQGLLVNGTWVKCEVTRNNGRISRIMVDNTPDCGEFLTPIITNNTSDQDTVITIAKTPIEVIQQDSIQQTDQDQAAGVATYMYHRGTIGIARNHTLSTITGSLWRKTTPIKKYPGMSCIVGFMMLMVFVLFTCISHPHVASVGASEYSDVTNSMFDLCLLRDNFTTNESNGQRSIIKHIMPDDCQLIVLSRLCQYVKWYMEHDIYIRT